MTAIQIMQIGLNVCEGLACIAGFIYCDKVKNTSWKWFPFYLLFILLAELTGKYLTYVKLIGPKVIMYNFLVIPTEILFYLSMFRYEFRNSKGIAIPSFSIVAYILCLVVDNIFFAKKYEWFLSFSYAFGVLLLVINILFFLFKLMVSIEISFYRTNFVFWICVGLLLFYLGSLPFHGIFNFLFRKYNRPFYTFVYVFLIFDYLMYLSFIIAFIWGKMKLQDS